MTQSGFLGEFEQMVLLATLNLGDEAYAVPIRAVLEDRTGRGVTRGALYTTLQRMERKGYLASRMGDPTPERGGRPKRYWRVTATGLAALREARDALVSLWAGVEGVLGPPGTP